MTTPGHACYLCHDAAHPGEPVLDTELTIDFEGDLAFCARCVADMARLYEFFSPDEKMRLESEVADLRNSLALATAEVRALSDRVREAVDA